MLDFYILQSIEEFDKRREEFKNIESIIVVCKDLIKSGSKAGKGNYPMDPILHRDQGSFYPVEPDKVTKFGHESYESKIR